MADNLNISPDMINNLVNMLKNSDHANTTAQSSSFNENCTDSNSNSTFASSDTQTDSNSSSIDFETILKIKSIMEALNTKNDPRSNLIHSLKPYLRKSKQAKLDQYANILKIAQVSNLFKNEKGDSK